MPSIITLFIIGLIFIGCGTDIEDLSKKAIDRQQKNINAVQSNFAISPTLQGTYTLQEGNYSYNGKLNRLTHTVTSSDLIIEKLDSDDYGYYFTMQVENLTPEQHNGIFHKRDNKFFHRLIYTPDITKESNITIDSNVSDLPIQTEIKDDEIYIKQDKNKLTINMKLLSGGGRINIIWLKESNSTTPMTKELKEAQHEYFKEYKERFNTFFKGE